MPPPAEPRLSNVDWDRLEALVGIAYPVSFRDFVHTYGASVWFDNVSPLYCEAQSDKEAREFLKSVERNLSPLKGNMYDERFNVLQLPLYPDEGGLFPFMVDYSSNLFCWQTAPASPETWPVVFWNRGPITIMENMTIAKMILHWLQQKPQMVEVWGNIDEYEPERIRLT